jgi:acyl-CoA dehydrogenase
MGAMGFTHEHILHHYTRRLWVWRRDFGSETYWGAKIGAAYAKAGPDALWASLSASRYAA